MGELEKSVCINTIILLTKKVIYNAMKEVKHPHILAIKNETKNFYFQEKYRLCVKGKRHIFERKFFVIHIHYIIKTKYLYQNIFVHNNISTFCNNVD